MGRHGRLELGKFGVEGVGFRAGGRRSDDRQLGRNLARREDPVETVVIGRADRLVFVVVAAAAGHRQAEEPAGHQIDAVVDDVVRIAEERAADGEEAERGKIGLRGRQFESIGGELERHEPVVGHVGREGPDNPIAVRPGEGIAGILVAEGIAHRVGVTGQIEPVTRPVLGMLRGRKQFLDEGPPRLLRRIRGKGIDPVGGWRKAGEIEPQPTDEGPGIGLGRGLEARGDDLRGHEAVEEPAPLEALGGVEPGGRFGGRVTGERLEGPMTLPRPDEPRFHVGRDRCLTSGRAFGPRPAPGGASRNPGFENRHLLGRERFVGGHRRLELAADHLQDLARCRVAGGEDRSRVAPLEHRREVVEPQPPFGHPLAMTALAAGDQQRPHLLLEQLFMFWGDRGQSLPPGEQSRREGDQQPRRWKHRRPEETGTADGASEVEHGGWAGTARPIRRHQF